MNHVIDVVKKLINGLPADRKNESFYYFISERLNSFFKLLKSVPESEMNQFLDSCGCMVGAATKVRFLNLVQKINNQCLEILQYAYKGDITTALYILGKLSTCAKNTQHKLCEPYIHYIGADRNEGLFYRCVDFSEKEEKEKINCWHVPFEKREYAGRNRFNQLGYPCFYLASSKECASKECGKIEKGKKRWCGVFRQKEKLYYLDFGLPNPRNISSYDLFSFLITYPLRIMCLTKANNREAKFCEEYIFSQLFFHFLFMHNENQGIHFDGIRYISMDNPQSFCIVIPALYDTVNPPRNGFSQYVLTKFEQVGELSEIKKEHKCRKKMII